MTWVRIISKFYRKLNSNTKIFFNYLGMKVEVPQRLIDSLDKRVLLLTASRGKSWVDKEFKKYNVIISIVSKVENHEYA